MSYKEPEFSQTYINDLLSRKEFYNLRINPDYDFRNPPFIDDIKEKFLKIHSYQLFIKNLINPNTLHTRLLIKHGTGVGKTLSAIIVAIEFIKLYKQQYQSIMLKMPPGYKPYNELDRDTPSVFVLGFSGTKTAFIRDLMNYPELGIISNEEKSELLNFRNIAKSRIDADIKRANDYYNKLRKKIINKKFGGFFKFYGYQEFVNRLFISDKISLIDLELKTSKNIIGDIVNKESKNLEEIIEEYIANGYIKVNKQLLKQFENSILICDECHNLYNSYMKNNYGVAIQYVLDHYPKMRALFLSATPINNSPTEIIDIANLLLTVENKIRKKDFFSNNRRLHDGKLKEIGKLLFGKISFLQDTNIQYYPKREIIGDIIKLGKEVDGKLILPYLKFIQCEMSRYHQESYNNLVNESLKILPKHKNNIKQFTKKTNIEETNTEETITNIVDTDTEEHLTSLLVDKTQIIREELMYELTKDYQPKIQSNSYTIYDMVFPNPDVNSPYGLYKSSETQSKIALAKPEWKKSTGIELISYGTSKIFTGKFLHINNIGKYSSKYKRMLEDILSITIRKNGTPETSEKIMIYHDRVRMSGVLIIQEILKENGFVDEFSEPINNTLCSICGTIMEKHNKIQSHDYLPARFIMAHSDIDKSTMIRSIEKYNAHDNINGNLYKILVGSKIIKESYGLKSVQNLLITTLPVNIPTLIQVFGRCIRINSHENLPFNQRIVKIRIYINRLNKDNNTTNDTVSPEEYRYMEKLNDYIIIQQIEKELNSVAIDAEINRDIVMPKILYDEYFKENPNKPIETIGNLYFESAILLKHYDKKELSMETFIAYGYGIEEVKITMYIIKRLFIIQRVWTYSDLFEAVKRPPFGLEINPELISEGNFVIALDNLIYDDLNIKRETIEKTLSINSNNIYRLFDNNDRFIYVNYNTNESTEKYKISQVGKYYILFPVKDNRIIKDINIFSHPVEFKKDLEINIENYVRDYKSTYNYEIRKKQFIDKYIHIDDISVIFSDYYYNFYFKLLEDIIDYYVTEQINPKSQIEVSKEKEILYDKIIDLFDQFLIIIYVEDLIKYKDTAKKISNTYIINNKNPSKQTSKLNLDTPIGYIAKNSIHIYDKPNWIEVSKISMNRYKSYNENEDIIGFFEISDDEKVRFKLRKSIQLLQKDIKKSNKIIDSRLVERGIACETRSKKELINLANKLNIKNTQDISRIKKLCNDIQKKLLSLEIKERQKDSRIKYVYLSHEERPNIIISRH